MSLLNDVKNALRISTSTYAFDGEISDLIKAAKDDLSLAGILKVIESDPLIKRAIITYVKAHFGINNPDFDKLSQSYEMLKGHLASSADYSYWAVTFNVTGGSHPIEGAEVTFNDEEKITGAAGQVVFYCISGNYIEYSVSADGYTAVEDNTDISADKTINIALSAG